MLVRILLFTFTLCLPLSSHAWWNNDWSNRKAIKIDTTSATGMPVASALTNVPVLVRLHAGNFDGFFDLQDQGKDIRFFAGDDKTPLKFQVERVDPVNGMAFIWVTLPQITPNDNSQTIYMYYGNAVAPAAADAAGIFDVNQTLTFNFAPGVALPQDQTAYANHAGSSTAEINANSFLSAGARFYRSQIMVPTKPILRFAPSSGWTFSSWVKFSENQKDGYIFFSEEANKRFVIGVDGTSLYARFQAGSTRIETKKVALNPNVWQHIAVTAQGSEIVLYVNGTVAANATGALTDFGGNLVFGAGSNGSNGFAGELDEIQLSNIERSADWIKFSAQSQGLDAKILAYGASEQAAQEEHGSTSYFGVILQSVTLDGWVVIGILAIMAVISWMVMFGKALLLRRVRKDNVAFLDDFKKLGATNTDQLDRAEAAKGEDDLNSSPLAEALFGKHDHYQSSSLYRIYHGGIKELHARLGASAGAQAAGLSDQAITTIRAGLDATLVREIQRLNSQMVLLTIAISGGPFLGLLGTVVGVMITFAAIAASGDVNVNAIAPGIAAALVATVAGLAVAIPSLFGYNYLTSRIKETVADMHVFVDEFIAKLAEHYGRG